jgi:plastocyanin
MNRWIASMLVGVALAIGGCGATTPSPTTSPSPSQAPISSLAGTPVLTPAATLVSTTEEASQAPAGAISIMMITLPNARPRFDPVEVAAKAGTVVFFLENIPYPPFTPDHNMVIGRAIYEELARTPPVRLNQRVTFTVNDLTPGTYVFWCSIKDIGNQADHAGQGMVGTLTIKP